MAPETSGASSNLKFFTIVVCGCAVFLCVAVAALYVKNNELKKVLAAATQQNTPTTMVKVESAPDTIKIPQEVNGYNCRSIFNTSTQFNGWDIEYGPSNASLVIRSTRDYSHKVLANDLGIYQVAGNGDDSIGFVKTSNPSWIALRASTSGGETGWQGYYVVNPATGVLVSAEQGFTPNGNEGFIVGYMGEKFVISPSTKDECKTSRKHLFDGIKVNNQFFPFDKFISVDCKEFADAVEAAELGGPSVGDVSFLGFSPDVSQIYLSIVSFNNDKGTFVFDLKSKKILPTDFPNNMLKFSKDI